MDDEKRERRLDSTLGNTIYEKQQVYGEQIPPFGIHIALDQRWRTASWPKPIPAKRRVSRTGKCPHVVAVGAVIFIKVAK
jgi:hypothetical protein